ncbi:MAG: glutaminyl-peptide cyclotransferase [Bacteroidia bacterium]
MNFRLSAGFILLAVFISSFSCSNSSNRSRKPVVQIRVESVNRKIVFGDDLNIAISVKVKDGNIRETKLYIDSALITSDTNAEFNFTVKKFENIGKHTLKAVSVKDDGIEGVYFKNFEVFSDIVPEEYGYEIVKTYPHNETFFTEGLEIHNGFLYESTGENGKSSLNKSELTSGKTVQSVKLSSRYFGEGITIFNNRIFQLTYKTKVGFVYQLENMAVIDSFHFESAEGWGMTHDSQNLIMSDGTNSLTYLDPVTYKTVKKLQVYDDQDPVVYLNELEYSEGFIYANVWTTNLLVKIDPKTGKVLSKIDLEGILTMSNPNKQVDVLNGIAIDPVTKKMYITGKLFPKLFEIKLVKKG